jgi:hypothetical protein
VCTACAMGSYNTSTDSTTCNTYSSCPIGSFITVDGTATSAPTCVLCPAGQTTTEANSHACVPVTN